MLLPSRRRTGFTLVELLVVLGIIVVLVSILLPVLKNIREQSKFVACSSNIHEILVGMNAYVSANDGALPVAPQKTDTYNSKSTDPVLQSLAYYVVPGGGTGSVVVNYRNGKFWQYLGSSNSPVTASPNSADPNIGVPDYRPRLFNCPTDTDGRTGGRNFSYSWNFNTRFAWADPKQTPPGVDRLANVIEPVHKIVLIEEQVLGSGTLEPVSHVGDPTDSGGHAPAVRHFKRANCGFADGHVDGFGLSDLGYTIDQSGAVSTVVAPTQSQQTTRAYYFRLNSNSIN